MNSNHSWSMYKAKWKKTPKKDILLVVYNLNRLRVPQLDWKCQLQRGFRVKMTEHMDTVFTYSREHTKITTKL